MNILTQIVSERRADVERARREVPPAVLRAIAAKRTHHSLAERLRCGSRPRIVAEMKKASPSAGLLCGDYRPANIAAAYAKSGAGGISVLTEPRHFMGHGDDLVAARKAVDLPILRKDFLCDEYQVLEAAAWGADVLLLIVAALSPESILRLYVAAMELGMEVLVEAHTSEELQVALDLENAIIGINSRNLKTLKTDLRVAHKLAEGIPENRVSIAESGIRCRADIDALDASGYDGFLIGEALMKSGSPGAGLRALIHDGR